MTAPSFDWTPPRYQFGRVGRGPMRLWRVLGPVDLQLVPRWQEWLLRAWWALQRAKARGVGKGGV